MDIEDPQEWVDIPDDLPLGEKDVCKVCRDDINDEEPWVTPCKCTGSVKYVHTECLKTWLSSSGKRHCDVCGHRYTFSKVYPKDVPSTIPPVVFVRHAIIWTVQITRMSFRAFLVAITWLVVLPLSCMYTLRSEISLSDLACALIITVTQGRDSTDVTEPEPPTNTTVGEAVAALANTTVASNSTVQGGLRLIDFVLRPVSSSWTVATSQWAKLLKGDYDAFAIRLLYLQGFTILLIALTIGFIFLREWIADHDWSKYDKKPEEKQQDVINPNDYIITEGISHRICDCPRCQAVKMVTEAIVALESDQVGAQEQARLAEERVKKVLAELKGDGQEPEEGLEAELGSAVKNDDVGSDPKPVLQQIMEEAVAKASGNALDDVEGRDDQPEASSSHDSSKSSHARLEHADIDSPNAGPGPQTAESRRRSSSLERQIDTLLEGHEASTDGTGSAPISAEEMRARRLRAFGGSAGSPAHAAAYRAPELLAGGQDDGAGAETAMPAVDRTMVAAAAQEESASAPSTSSPVTASGQDGSVDAPVASSSETPELGQPESSASKPPDPSFAGEEDTDGMAADTVDQDKDAEALAPRIGMAESAAQEVEHPQPEFGEHPAADDAIDTEHDDNDRDDFDVDDDGDWEDMDTQVEDDDEEPDQDLLRRRAEGLAVAIARFNREAGAARGEDVGPDGRLVDLEGDEDEAMLDGGEEPFADDEHLEEFDDAWWAREDLESMLMLLGLIGPVSGLLTNLVIGIMFLTATNSILIGGPLIIGRILLVTDHLKAFIGHVLALSRLIRLVTDPLVDIAWEILSEVVLRPGLVSFHALESIIARKFGFTGESPSGRIISWASGLMAGTAKASAPSGSEATAIHGGTEKLLDGLAFVGRNARVAYSAFRETSLRIALSSSTTDRIFCVLVGHLAIVAIVSGIALVARFQSGSMSATVRRQVFKLMMVWKLIGFFVVELAVFPLVVGLVMNLATIPLFQGATLAGRLHELRTSPFTIIFIAWITGTSFMFNFAQSLSWVRRLGRPGMMFFIRDPNDPDFKPVENILDQPSFSQARKITTSLVMYTVLVWWLLGMGPWIIGSIPSLGILPLRYKGYGPLSHTPFDLLFLLIAGENLVQRLRALHYAKKVVALYWTSASRALRLTPLMQGLRHPAGEDVESTPLAELTWRVTDRICRLCFGNYPIEATVARVPAVDTVIFPPKWGRRTPIFVPLTNDLHAKTTEDKIRIIKQDEAARKAHREPAKEYTTVWLPKYWRTRVHVFTFAFAVALGIGIAAALLVPLVVGRGLMYTFMGQEVHDGHSIIVGVLSIAVTAKFGRLAQKRLIKTQRARRQAYRSALSRRLKRSFMRVLQKTYVFLTLYGAYPLLRGMVFEVQWGMILRYGMKEVVPVVNVWDAWSLGLIFAVLRGIFQADGGRPLGGRGHWHRVRIHDIIRRPFGIRNIRGFDKAIRPEMAALAAKLMMPHLLSALAVALGSVAGSTARFRAMQYRCAGPTSFMVCAVFEHRRTIRRWAKAIRQRVLEAEYSVEERILNYVPDDAPHRPAGTLLTIDPPPAAVPAAGEVIIEQEGDVVEDDIVTADEMGVRDDGEEAYDQARGSEN